MRQNELALAPRLLSVANVTRDAAGLSLLDSRACTRNSTPRAPPSWAHDVLSQIDQKLFTQLSVNPLPAGFKAPVVFSR
jgi:hypothetical protein